MSVFVITLVVVSISFLAMCLGTLLFKRTIKGSCGGIKKIMNLQCLFCDKRQDCSEENSEAKTI